MNKIIIVGAGASGLFCSLLLSKQGYDVTIIEKNSKAGRKILASGNGKCNITNSNLSLENFNTSTNNNFIKYSIENMPFKKIKDLFYEMGLQIVKGDGTKIYPLSMQSSSVSEILYDTAIHNGVRIIFNEEIENIKCINEEYNLNNKYKCKYLILANGSNAMAKLGSSNSGYKFAKQFNHNITTLLPSLVQLKSDDKSLFSLSGVKVNAVVTLVTNNKNIKTISGDVLFTKYGISGNSILELSRKSAFALDKNNKVLIHIDLMPEYSSKKLFELLQNRKFLLKNKNSEFLLKSIINDKLINYIFKLSNIVSDKIDNLTKQDISNITHCIKNININIKDTNGFENAEVVAGGIDLNEVCEKTMQSKKHKNLFFCGEILDVDGNCGGYNFHWAWSSAYTLANNFKGIK